MIKTWDYLDTLKNEKQETLSAIDRVLQSGQLILGKSVNAFETNFASYCNVKYGVGVNSATDALFLILKALNIGENNEVITVSNTAIPTVSAIVSTGAMPKFVDIDKDSYLIDVEKIEGVITKSTKCILVVHLYGQCVDMNKIDEITTKYKLKVVEDCAQACGAEFFGKKAGSMSDAAAFSFYPTKILGGYGDAGMVITNDKELYKRIRRLRSYGIEKDYFSIEHGYNSRLDELHAEILNTKLRHIEEYINKRIVIANNYFKFLADTSLVLPKILKNRKHVFNLFVVRHKNRDKILKQLAKQDIFLDIDYPYPIHTMIPYKYVNYTQNLYLKNTEKVAKEIFSLPMYPDLSYEKQTEFMKVLKKYV